MRGLSKDKRDRILLVSIGTAMVVGLIWLLFINAQRQTLAAAQRKLDELRSRLANAERLLKQEEEIKAELQTRQEQLRAVEDTMAPADKFTWLNQILTRFRLPYNVEIAEFGQPVEGPVQMFPEFPYKAATFTIRGSGYFHDLGKFFADFENNFPYVRLQNLELTPSPDVSLTNSEKLTFKVDIVALVRPPATL
jgi:Tfp pilus assembly protein PilO